MPLLETISSAINGIKAAKVIAEGVMAVDAKVKDSTHNLQLAELSNELAKVLTALALSTLDVTKLITENADLKQRLTAKNLEQYKLAEGVYKKEGLELVFCPHCLHKDGTESVLCNLDSNLHFSLQAIYRCNCCKGHFGEYVHKPPVMATAVPIRHPFMDMNW